MQLNTAISKLTIYAIRHPEQEKECLKLIDLLSENFVVTTYDKTQITSTTLNDAVKNLFYKASFIVFEAPNLRFNIKRELQNSISSATLKQLSELIYLYNESTVNMEKFFTLFDLGIEEKLGVDFSEFKKAAFPFSKNVEYLNTQIRDELNTFPFMRVAQYYLKDAITLKNITDMEKIKNFNEYLSQNLQVYNDFKKINDEVKFFDENNLKPLEKTSQYANDILQLKTKDLYCNECDPWESMHFRN